MTPANNAAAVPEGALKPESTFAFNLKTASAITIAHWTHASKQILDDAPQLQLFLQTRLAYGLRLKEELQILNGDGAIGNLRGLMTAASVYSRGTISLTWTVADVVRDAISWLEENDMSATGIVMNPAFWKKFEMEKANTGEYLTSNPSSAQPARVLWGLPVVVTTAMVGDNFLLGDFSSAATLFDRQQPTLDIATQDQDDFVRNLVKLRVEERVAMTINNRGALLRGNFATS